MDARPRDGGPDAGHGAAALSPAELKDRTLVITRTFDAPRELMFKLWTQPEHLARWWGPKGFTVMTYVADARPGGRYRFGVRSPENTTHHAHGVYREVRPPERLAFTFSWEDGEQNPKHETLVTLTFADAGGGRTLFTLHQTTFESMTSRDMHNDGWSTTFDLLAAYIATL